MKARTFVTQIGDVPIDNEIILQALAEFNAEAEGLLGVFPDVQYFATKDPAEAGVHHYSESQHLSILTVGTPIRALDLRGLDQAVQLRHADSHTPDLYPL